MTSIPAPSTAHGADPLASPRDAAAFLADAAVAAGAVALGMFQAGVRTWSKHNDSPVTEADIAVDRLLHERLMGAAPGYGWLSEETADAPVRLDRRRVWIVDPIDGTRAFIAGGEDWVVSAALVEDDRPVAGVLFAPVTGELFVAARGEGTRLNGRSINAATREQPEGASIAGPVPMIDHFYAGTGVRSVPRIRSLALRIARVATGEIDAALASPNGNDWDLAAADLLVHEARGLLTTLDGRTLSYNAPDPRHGALVSAGAGLHAALLRPAA